jgi:hypothetical protein
MAEFHDRARRYAVGTSLQYRRPGTDTWHAAWTVNFSHAGVLFTTDGPAPELGGQIEFIVALPVSGALDGSQVRCTGRVTRIETDELGGNERAVAATIDHYHFNGSHHAAPPTPKSGKEPA